MDTPERINARLDEETQQQLHYLMQATGQSISLVVRESVAHYYAQVRRERAPSRLLGMAGTWRSAGPDTQRGAARSASDSAEPKAAVQAALRAKYPQHMTSPDARPRGARGRKR